ncbi:hypothetical protein [Thalassospira xiamenensis]|uniref:Uncharacterized protein n=1 Tax=Thalassospira xiamenensis TaxID=220697 RepID=A0A285TXH4_9PROT|nr:hypothetical protein [Thalassospira xiamenensis]SOC30536.1 hypothetical protein SAMN05428964_10987 [Thalassospira xiamenensis]
MPKLVARNDNGSVETTSSVHLDSLQPGQLVINGRQCRLSSVNGATLSKVPSTFYPVAMNDL